MKSKYFTPELARFLFDKGLLTIAEKRHEEYNRQEKEYFAYPIMRLDMPFVWEETNEGLVFWGKLNDEFKYK